jgi:hypothetical protein
LNLKTIEIFKESVSETPSEFGECLTKAESQENLNFSSIFLQENPIKLTLPLDVDVFHFEDESPDDAVLNSQKNQKLTKEHEINPIVKKK